MEPDNGRFTGARFSAIQPCSTSPQRCSPEVLHQLGSHAGFVHDRRGAESEEGREQHPERKKSAKGRRTAIFYVLAQYGKDGIQIIPLSGGGKKMSCE